MSLLAKFTAVAIAAVSLGGCAYVGTEPNGTTNIVGLAAVSVTPHPGSPPPRIRVQSLGVTISDQAPDSGVVLGYSDRDFQPQYRGAYPNIDFVGRTQSGVVVDDGDYESRPMRRHHHRYYRYHHCRCR